MGQRTAGTPHTAWGSRNNTNAKSAIILLENLSSRQKYCLFPCICFNEDHDMTSVVIRTV